MYDGISLNSETLIRRFVRWGIYPISWIYLLLMLIAVEHGFIEGRDAWLLFVITLVLIFVLLERLVPYQERWSMTTDSFLNDLKYLFVNGATTGVFSMSLGIFSISSAGQENGLLSDWPPIAQLVICLFVFESLQYSLHRFEHEGRGRFARFMWRVHSAHHLPDKLYIAMHVAGHPINALLVQGVIMIIPIWLLGYDESVVVAFLLLNSMHGLLSHFNVDVRIGWMNYLFIGPELHRYHHSAKVSEGKNYGATLSFLDLIFGTLVYNPGVIPDELGVHNPKEYPAYGELLKVLSLPFRAVGK